MEFATRRLTLLFLFGVLPSCSGLAQEWAAISGQVTDATGAAVTSAQVTVTSAETGAQRSLVSDGSGRFNAPSLAVGSYRIAASKSGFETAERTGVRLVVGQEATVNLTLSVGQLQQVVTVEEKPDIVSVSTQQTSGLVDEKQVKDLPLNGRSYDELMSLNPGIVNYTSEKSGGVGTSNSAIGNMFSVSGRRPQESLFLLNGIEYTSASEINLTPGGASGQLLGVDAVREFNVLSDTYGADYGKRPGAQVNIVTSSGSNQIHGSLYEFLRNSDLDARNFFDRESVAPFKRNEFGGAIGGPLQKDKTFLFGNYEGYRQSLGLSDVTLVPDTEARLGYVPEASGKLVDVGVAKAVRPLLSLWPVQNGPELGDGIAEAFSNPLQHIREDFGTTRIDHIFSSKDTLSGIYTVDDSGDVTPTANPLSTILENLREQVASVEETHVFSPRLVNTARVGFSRANFNFNSEAPTDAASWIVGEPIGAVVIGGGTASNSATQISNAGTNVASNTFGTRNLFSYEDQVDINLGRNHLQAGVWIQRIQSNDNFAQAQYGQASFSTLTSFLEGTVSTFTAVPDPTELGWRSIEAAEFLEDTIKFTPHLEVKLGFRAESTDGWNEAHGRASNYLFQNGVIETNPQISSSALSVNKAKFLPEPRVGLSWAPFGHENTIINAGFGIYDALLDNISYRLDQDAPYNITLSVKNVKVSRLDIIPGAALPAGGLISPGGVQPNMNTPTILSYTFKVEQKLSTNTSLAVGYVGSHGYHEILSLDANEPFPNVLPDGNVYYAPGSKLANPKVANTTSWFSEGISSYNALQVDVNHRFAAGLQLRGVYTYSKSLDDGGTLNTSVGTNTPAFTMYPLDPKLDWGRSPFDVRNLAVLNGTYDLPFGRGKRALDRVIGGWTVGGVATLQSGFPFSPQLGYNPTNNGDTRNPIRPSWNANFTGPVVLGSANKYFNPAAFVTPAAGTYGDVGRDVLTGPGIATLDFSAMKNIPLNERFRLQFRSEFFNIANHANFATPNPVVFTSATSGPASTAGLISATSTTSRQIQFGLKLLW